MNHVIHFGQYQGLYTLSLVQEFYMSKGLIACIKNDCLSNYFFIPEQKLSCLSYYILILQEKAETLSQISGEEVLKGDEFKNYISSLRGKSSQYKMKKAELSDLRAEFGVLSRTNEILKSKEMQMNQQLVGIKLVTAKFVILLTFSDLNFL